VAGILCRVILAASLIGIFWSAGYAAPEVGNAVAVVQRATAKGSDGKRKLKAGMPISIGELIKTGRTGLVQIIFTDDTRLVIGPNSSLVIEAYLLRSENTVSKFAVKAFGGTFRFITGKSPKQAYSITTPTGTIGIRGTSLDIVVRRNSTDLVLFSGEVELCGNRGCILVKDACGLARAPRNADVSLERSLERRNRQISARFPYIVSQAPLRRDFHVSTRSCGEIPDARIRLRRDETREPREPREAPAPQDPKNPP